MVGYGYVMDLLVSEYENDIFKKKKYSLSPFTFSFPHILSNSEGQDIKEDPISLILVVTPQNNLETEVM